MDKISCDVCLDLLPLVRDGVASADSCALVRRHMADCPACAQAYGGELDAATVLDDGAVLSKLRKRLALVLGGAILAGALLGLALSDGMGLFYNALILPVIGGFGFLLLRKKAHWVPLSLFGLTFLWVAIREVARGFFDYGSWSELIVMSTWWAALFAGFAALGVLIARLLSYAFGREK